MIRAYHFIGPRLRNGEPIPPDGEWLSVDAAKLKMCQFGLHASEHPLDALGYAPGFTLCLVDLDGEVLRESDKLCAEKRRIIARFDARELVLKFARDCASDVLHLWDAPQVVKDFLATGENAQKAAYAANAALSAYAYVCAAHDAAYAAALGAYVATNAYARAARDAAYAAASAPAYADKYRGWLAERVSAQFEAMGVNP